MSDPILLPAPQALPKPVEPAGRFLGPNLLPLLLIPLLLRWRSRGGIFTLEQAGEQRAPLISFPKIFNTNDVLDVLGAIEPHFRGYKQEFVNTLMGIMDVHSSIRSLRQRWTNSVQTGAETTGRTGPDPISVFQSLIPLMTDDIRIPTERYINIIGSARNLMQQWRTAGGLLPNIQSGDFSGPLMGFLNTLVPGSDRIAQAVNLYQAMRKADAPGHDGGTAGVKDRDTRGSLARLLELAKDMGGKGTGPGAMDLAGLLSRIKTP